MKNTINCAIASTLDIGLPDVDNLKVKLIDSNEAFQPDSYSILVLDKSIHTLYKGVEKYSAGA